MRRLHGLGLAATLALGVVLGQHFGGGGETIADSISLPRVEGRESSHRSATQRFSKSQAGESNGSGGEHRVRLVLPRSMVEGAVTTGIWGKCDESVPSEECSFTLDAAHYHLSPEQQQALKFHVVCTDLAFATDISWVPNCSPVERGSIDLGIGPGVAVNVGGQGGVAAGAFASLEAGVDVGLGLSVPIKVHQRLRYPYRRHFTRRIGGNVLVDSGIGSIMAGRSVAFGHTQFDGLVTYFVTKPVGMRLVLGVYGREGVECHDGGIIECPADFYLAMEQTCLAGNLPCGVGATAGDSPHQMAGIESDFDMQELVDALNAEANTLRDIADELNRRMEEKITDVFNTMKDRLGRDSTAAAGRTVMLNELLNLLKERLAMHLRDIRDIIREQGLCAE